jgi:hypothetical protein
MERAEPIVRAIAGGCAGTGLAGALLVIDGGTLYYLALVFGTGGA